jgi:hypothetical protein
MPHNGLLIYNRFIFQHHLIEYRDFNFERKSKDDCFLV